MWIVKLALRRPYTFLVLAILITLLGVFSIIRTPTDIFPDIKIPVVAAIWRYTGLSPDEMATRLVLSSERTAQTTVNDVEHTESQSLSGTSVVKYFFHPNVNEELSFAQITGVSQTGLRQAPPGTTPPFILAYNASSVPILQLAFSHRAHRPCDRAGRLHALSLRRAAAPGAGGPEPRCAARAGAVG
jgi:multidrug efflux pump subunit AcrB